MAPGARGNGKPRVAQETFDALVKENMEEFGMDFEEAAEDAVKTLTMQGADLSGIITSQDPNSNHEHPVVQLAKYLSEAVEIASGSRESNVEQIVDQIKLLQVALQESGEGEKFSAVAGKHGAVEGTLKCLELLHERGKGEGDRADGEEEGLELLATLLSCDDNRAAFFRASGASAVVSVMQANLSRPSVLAPAASVIDSACAKFEVNKEAFMEREVHLLLIDSIRRHLACSDLIQRCCDAIRALTSADDPRVAASKAFGNARTIAAAGGANAILEAAEKSEADISALTSLLAALGSISVNEEICRTVAKNGGIFLAVQVLRNGSSTGRSSLARSACSLLSQLSGSDGNKVEIVRAGGMELLVEAMRVFGSNPSVLQQSMATVAGLTLRLPEHAEEAVEAGVLDVVAEAMESPALTLPVLRQACMMLRNLAVRSPAIRSKMMEKDFEALLRRVAVTHEQCKDVASAVLRDMGLDRYHL